MYDPGPSVEEVEDVDLLYIERAMGARDGVLGYEDREEVDAPIEAGERMPCRPDGPDEPRLELVAWESLGGRGQG